MRSWAMILQVSFMLPDGRWVLIPPRVVLEHLAPDGRSHICASKSPLT
jgi:hypothetical protein